MSFLFLLANGILAATLAAAPADSPPSWRYVCEDAGAGGYEAFPDVCRLSDGRLMAVFYAGYGHVAMPNEQLPKGGRICYCTSADEGHTWTKAQVLYDGPDDDRDPSIVQLKSGRLVCNFFSLAQVRRTRKNRGSGWARGSSPPTTSARPGPRPGRSTPTTIAARRSASFPAAG